VDLDDLPTDFGGVGGEAWVGWAGLLGLSCCFWLVFGGFWVGKWMVQVLSPVMRVIGYYLESSLWVSVFSI
jgi:hypothetical protein